MTITIYKQDTMELICLINIEDRECIIKGGYDIMIDDEVQDAGTQN